MYQIFFCERNCTKTTVFPVMSKQVIPFSLQRGKVFAMKFYTVPFTSEHCMIQQHNMHLKPLVVLLCHGLKWDRPVSFYRTGRFLYFFFFFLFSCRYSIVSLGRFVKERWGNTHSKYFQQNILHFILASRITNEHKIWNDDNIIRNSKSIL